MVQDTVTDTSACAYTLTNIQTYTQKDISPFLEKLSLFYQIWISLFGRIKNTHLPISPISQSIQEGIAGLIHSVGQPKKFFSVFYILIQNATIHESPEN